MFERYVALGDSETEGLGDGDEVRGYRGWADRLADRLADLNPDVRYANLAVRGKVSRQIRAEQLDAAIALQPDLATVLGGWNDVFRPRFDADATLDNLDAMYAGLRALGATVATATFPDVSKLAPLARRLLPRVLALNDGIRESAGRHGVLVVEAFGVDATVDPRLWGHDRVHATPDGHDRIAHAFAHALGIADDAWTHPLPPAGPAQLHEQVVANYMWVRTFLLPWISRRLRGVSSGDGYVAKRPALLPVRS